MLVDVHIIFNIVPTDASGPRCVDDGLILRLLAFMCAYHVFFLNPNGDVYYYWLCSLYSRALLFGLQHTN